MNLMIPNPAAPEDKSKAVALTREQVTLLQGAFVKFMNREPVNGKKMNTEQFDAYVVSRLIVLGKPINFGDNL